jgi:hypothetical protein
LCTHWFGRIDLDDLQSEHSYAPGRAYAQSKLAMLMFAGELHVAGRRRGALPTPYAALDPAAAPDGYYGPQKFFGMSGPAGPARRSRRSRDTAVAARLWDASVALTGVTWRAENVVPRV